MMGNERNLFPIFFGMLFQLRSQIFMPETVEEWLQFGGDPAAGPEPVEKMAGWKFSVFSDK